MIKIAVPGVNGRMGQAVANAVIASNDLHLEIAMVRDTSNLLGSKVANSDVVISNHINPNFDVMIDFTLPEALIQHVVYCQENSKAMVIGTTGLSHEQIKTIEQASEVIPIVLSSNMSIGVNICFKLLAQAAKMLKNTDISIIDLHHQHKKDAPSGTAKTMANIIAKNAAIDLDKITINSQREGEIIGAHIVSFNSPSETITIAHEANSRHIFAEGAVVAARWIYGRQPGLYSMLDVISG